MTNALHAALYAFFLAVNIANLLLAGATGKIGWAILHGVFAAFTAIATYVFIVELKNEKKP